MYESYFKFEKSPFKVVPDPSMLFASHSVREAMSRLEFAVRTGKGITVMTGEVGTGKTTLVNRFLDKAGPDTQTAYVFNPTLTGLQLLKTLADELGVQTYGMAKVDLTRALYESLLRTRQAGRRTIVFVDEAQALSREALEELRLISNLETWQEKLLHIVLVGQPELLEKLESFNLRQLRQRVELFVQIEPMTASETRQYIEHRIRIANPLREVTFTEGACQRVHQIAGGIPRTVNIVCDASLLVAYVAETNSVTAAHVRDAVRTIDAGQVSLRIRPPRRARFWHRLWGSAAACLLGIALLSAIDGATGQRGVTAGRGLLASALAMVRPGPAANPSPAVSPAAVPQSTRALVHLHSARTQSAAEEFAARLVPEPGQVVYLQSIDSGNETWHRVLLGDFATFAAADAYARAGEAAGRFAYARAVAVASDGLVVWHRSDASGAAAAAGAVASAHVSEGVHP
jgi:general secretion pathway protein A